MFDEVLGYMVIFDDKYKILRMEYDVRSKFTNVKRSIIYASESSYTYAFVETEDPIKAINTIYRLKEISPFVGVNGYMDDESITLMKRNKLRFSETLDPVYY